MVQHWFSLLFADKAGVQKDLVLGYDNVTGYEEHTSYFGAIIGRNGNRIKDSRFTINGKEYRIDENENHNNLHSGKNGFNTVIWEVREHTDNSITFYHYSSETEQKFPGNMEITLHTRLQMMIHCILYIMEKRMQIRL